MPEWACPQRPLCAVARSVAVAAACLLAVVVGTWYALSSRVDADGKMERSFFDIWPRQQREPGRAVDDLEAALCGAADANRTLVLSVLNKAYAEEEGGLLDLFMESLKQGQGTAELIPHVLLVATDTPAFLRCQSLGRVRCYRLPADDSDKDKLSSEQVYMSEGFIRLMWRRVRLLGDVLRHGYSFVFTDMDVMLLRNPFLGLNRTMEEDLLISCDRFNGAPEDYLGNDLNTGFFFVSASNRMVALFEEWHAARERDSNAGMKEQDVLNQMKREGALGRLGVRARVLDTARFSGFCQDSRDALQVATVHANCCRTIRAKVADLRAVLAAAPGVINGTAAAEVAWPAHTECVKSWG